MAVPYLTEITLFNSSFLFCRLMSLVFPQILSFSRKGKTSRFFKHGCKMFLKIFCCLMVPLFIWWILVICISILLSFVKLTQPKSYLIGETQLSNCLDKMVLYAYLSTEVSVLPGPTVIQSQRNSQRLLLIINCLAY